MLTPEQRNNLAEWLAYYGFKDNPFHEYRAQDEVDHAKPNIPDLSEYFVETPFYDEILGTNEPPRTMLVYAARGCGKSAHRIMVGRACRPGSTQSQILAITYDDFGQLPEIVRQGSRSVTAYEHVAQILTIGVRTFVDALTSDPELAKKFGPQWLGRLRWFCDEYSSDVISAPEIWTRISKLVGDNPGIDYSDFLAAYSAQRLLDRMRRTAAFEHPAVRFILHIVASALDPVIGKPSAAGRFEQFETLVRYSGLDGIYVLVDGLDEADPLSYEADTIVNMLVPLLRDLTLIRQKHSAFKIFLPLELQAKLADRPGIRHALLAPREIAWLDPRLMGSLLEQRLSAFSSAQITDMAALCDLSLNSTISQDMIRHARAVPRNLMRLGESLLIAHARREGGGQLLTMTDWEAALSEFYDAPLEEWPQSPLPPLLRLDEQHQMVLLGAERIRLTDTEFFLLKFLYDRPNQVVSYTILQARLEISKENTHTVVKRIRRKIEKDVKHPLYLTNVYGRGLRLDHVGKR